MTIKELDEMPPEQMLAQRGNKGSFKTADDPYTRIIDIIRRGRVAEVKLADVRGASVNGKVSNVRSAIARRLSSNEERAALAVRRSRNEKAAYITLVRSSDE